MSKKQISTLIPVKLALWGAIFFSTEALVYYLRWFVPFLSNQAANATNYSHQFLRGSFKSREPQTMYFLLAIILWAVRQFVSKALVIKTENEAFV